jgi:hypothetical protein
VVESVIGRVWVKVLDIGTSMDSAATIASVGPRGRAAHRPGTRQRYWSVWSTEALLGASASHLRLPRIRGPRERFMLARRRSLRNLIVFILMINYYYSHAQP